MNAIGIVIFTISIYLLTQLFNNIATEACMHFTLAMRKTEIYPFFHHRPSLTGYPRFARKLLPVLAHGAWYGLRCLSEHQLSTYFAHTRVLERRLNLLPHTTASIPSTICMLIYDGAWTLSSRATRSVREQYVHVEFGWI